MLYTIVPMEQVFDEEEIRPLRMMSYGGRTVGVRPTEDGFGVIDHLVSTNPFDYLDPRWQPGTQVSLNG